MDRVDYDRCLAAFNARDYDGVCDFYAEPMNMNFFGVSLRSRADMKRFYGFLHSYVKESLSVGNFASSDTLTAVDAIYASRPSATWMPTRSPPTAAPSSAPSGRARSRNCDSSSSTHCATAGSPGSRAQCSRAEACRRVSLAARQVTA